MKMEIVKIPQERVAMLIGREGETKRQIERLGKVKIRADEEGDVEIEGEPFNVWRTKDVVKAIGRGFNPEKTMKLFSEDYYFKLIDLRELFGSEKEIKRYKGRVIGERGRSRRIIEETSEADVCIYGDTVGIIGTLEELQLAEAAIEKLLDGASHATVYAMLERGRRRMKEERMKEIWNKK